MRHAKYQFAMGRQLKDADAEKALEKGVDMLAMLRRQVSNYDWILVLPSCGLALICKRVVYVALGGRECVGNLVQFLPYAAFRHDRI